MTIAGRSLAHAIPYEFQALIQPPAITLVSPLTGPVLGGTLVTLHGTLFAFNATVLFVERDGSGDLTGRRSECAWRTVPGLTCNETVVQYVAAHHCCPWSHCSLNARVWTPGPLFARQQLSCRLDAAAAVML